MGVGTVSNQNAYVGNGGADLLTTMQMLAQRQVSRQLAQQAAEAVGTAAQAAVVQAFGAGQVDLYL